MLHKNVFGIHTFYVLNTSKLKVRAPEPYGEAGAEVVDEVLLVPSGGGSKDS